MPEEVDELVGVLVGDEADGDVADGDARDDREARRPEPVRCITRLPVHRFRHNCARVQTWAASARHDRAWFQTWLGGMTIAVRQSPPLYE